MINYERLRLLIEESGKTRTYICKKIGKPAYYFRDVLKQKTNIPDADLEIIAYELNTTSAYIKGETDEKDTKNPSTAIIKQIEVRLIEIGMTKSEFYEKSGISSASYSQWNSGLYNPSKRKIQRAAECLGVPFEYLWDEKSIKNPPTVSGEGTDSMKARIIDSLDFLSPDQVGTIAALTDTLRREKERK